MTVAAASRVANVAQATWATLFVLLLVSIPAFMGLVSHGVVRLAEWAWFDLWILGGGATVAIALLVWLVACSWLHRNAKE